MREEDIRRIAGYRCKYYEGWDQPVCKANVNLHDLINLAGSPGAAYRVPCCGPNMMTMPGQEKARCEKYTLLTEAEIQEELKRESDFQGHWQRVQAIIAAIKGGHPSGPPLLTPLLRTFNCPRCNKNTFSTAYTVSGKVAGSCRSCQFGFME